MMTRPGHRLAVVLAAVVAACGSDALAPSRAPVSVAHSVVSVSSPTVLAGAGNVLTLVAYDAFGERLRGGGLAVGFAVSGGTSAGTVGVVTDHADGSYSALFTGITAGTPATVNALVDGTPVTTPLPTVQVLPGPVSPVVSTVRVTPATILVSATATVELVTRDAQGNHLIGGGRLVAFGVSGGTSAGTLGPTTDHGDGRYSAVFTATARGTPVTVSATVDGVPVATALPTVTVAAGVSPDSSYLEVSSDTVSIGGDVTLTLRVVDSAGVARTSGGETVVFTALASPGAGQGTIDSTVDHDDGSYTANFTATAAGGAIAISATLDGRPVMGGPTITVHQSGISPQHSSIAVSADTVAAGGSALLTLVVRDADSVPASGGGLSVVFTTTTDGGSSTGTIGAATDHGDGTYSAPFTGQAAGSPTTIGAIINDSSQVQMLDSLGVSHLPTITVIPGPHAVDSTIFSVFPATLTLGDSARLLLEVRDGFGNPVGQGGRSVLFGRVGGPGTSVGRIGTVADQDDGRYSAWYVADSAGTPDTLTARLDGVLLATRPAISVSCVAGPVSVIASDLAVNDSILPSGVSTTVTVRVRDGVGCPVTLPHQVVVSVAGGTSTGSLGPVADQGDGSYTAIFTGQVAGTATSVSASVDGVPLSRPPARLTVVPGDISPQTSSVTILPAQVDSGGHATATLQARDAAGNSLVTGGRQVTLAIHGATPHGTLGPTTYLGNGRYIAVYTATLVEPGVPDPVTASIEGTPVATAPPSVEVVAGTISPDQSLVTAPAASVVVGDSLLVTLEGRDASGRSLVSGDRTVAIGFSLGGGTSTGTFGPVENLGNGSYAVWLTATGAGTAVAIEVVLDGLPVTTSLPTLTVVPPLAP